MDGTIALIGQMIHTPELPKSQISAAATYCDSAGVARKGLLLQDMAASRLMLPPAAPANAQYTRKAHTL